MSEKLAPYMAEKIEELVGRLESCKGSELIPDAARRLIWSLESLDSRLRAEQKMSWTLEKSGTQDGVIWKHHALALLEVIKDIMRYPQEAEMFCAGQTMDDLTDWCEP